MEAPAQLGRYRIDGMLGRGGMGAVYRAFDTALERPVALKVMLHGDRSGTAAERMRREAKAAAKLDHPNVVRIYDVAELEGQLCIAMEFLEGRSLAAHLGQGRVSQSDAVSWLQQTASALAAAHAAGIVHRDIKPENLHVLPDGTVKVLDFGIVHQHDTELGAGWETLTDEGAIIGTPSYMAPEQLAQLPFDGRADQFSWAVVAYELFTGRLPWPEGSVLQTLTAVLESDPPTAAEVRPRVDPIVSDVIARAMQKDPDQRFPTIDDAARALEAAFTGARETLVVPRGTLPPDAAPAHARATGGSYRLLGAALALLAAAIGIALFLRRQRAPATTTPTNTAIRAFTDLPPPKTEHKEALAAYRQGLQGYRSGERNLDALQRAVELDPTLAAAHMRLAVRRFSFEPDAARAHATEAIRFAEKLSVRDRRYLAMVQPMVLSQPRDAKTWLERANEAVEAFPEDAEFWFLRGWALSANGEKDAGRKAFRRATELDPAFAWAWQFLGESQAVAGDLTAAQASFDSCLDRVTIAHTCRMLRSILFASEGRCDAHRRDIEQLRAIDAKTPDTLERYAFALAAAKAGAPAIDEVTVELQRIGPAWRWHRQRAKWFAHRGSFSQALAALDAWDEAVTDRDESRRGEAATLRVLILLETSTSDAAARYALDYLHRREAWIKNTGAQRLKLGLDAVPAMLEALRVAKRDEHDELRAGWLAEGAPRDPAVAWLHREAAFAHDEASARVALEAAPEGAPPAFAPLSYITALQGHVLLTAGRVDEAVPWLEKAVNECRRFKWPILYGRAELELGRALETQGDRLGACRTYDALLDRWSPAVSRTASEAQRRRRSLACP